MSAPRYHSHALSSDVLPCYTWWHSQLPTPNNSGNAASNYKRHKAQSTWGQGATTPDPKATKTLEDGAVKVPMGKGVPSGVQGSLLYGAFIRGELLVDVVGARQVCGLC